MPPRRPAWSLHDFSDPGFSKVGPVMLYRVHHSTRYTYSRPVTLCHNLAHLTPRPAPSQQCHRNRVRIEPTPSITCPQVDYFGNPATYFTIHEPHRELSVIATHITEVAPTPPLPAESPAWDMVRTDLARDPQLLDAYQFAFDSPYVRAAPALLEYAVSSFPAGRPLIESCLELMSRVYTDFKYDAVATSIATPLSEVLANRRGVCQDFAHLMTGCLRSLGLAARYVSGYLSTTPPPGQARLVGADASHAWLSVFCPGVGWIDLDPTNNMIPSEKHILLAWGRDFGDVSPIKGVILGGGRHAVIVGVDVAPLDSHDEMQERS